MECCLFTRGEVFIRDAVSECTGGIMDILCNGGPFRKVGNVSSLIVNIDGEPIGTENEFHPALPESRLEIRSVTLDLVMTCASDENLRMSFLSEKEEKDSGTFVDSAVLCQDISQGDFIPFTHTGASNVSVFLLNEGVETPLVLDVDYSLEESGIKFLRDIPRGVNEEVRVRYDYTDEKEEFQFFSTPGRYKEVFFKGTNFGEDGGVFDARFYRVLFGPMNENDLITKDGVFTISLFGVAERVDGNWFKVTKG